MRISDLEYELYTKLKWLVDAIESADAGLLWHEYEPIIDMAMGEARDTVKKVKSIMDQGYNG